MSARAQVWSYGGGVQTAAIACLIVEERLPVPDVTVMADTGREKSSTWDYLHNHIAPLLAARGVTVEIAPHSLATVDVTGLNGDVLVPAWTASGGRLPTLCSNEWKRRVVHRWLRERGYGPKNPVAVWLGISVDEVHRAKDSDVQWAAHHYPLLFDAPMRRDECVALVRRHGLPDAPKSSCWMCPHMSVRQWDELRVSAPDDFAKAVALDAEMRRHDPDTYVHRSGKPLPLAPVAKDTEQPDFFDACDSGVCWT